MADDYYAILGVERDATSQDIKRAFRNIARECHPDRNRNDEASEERFKKARQAYETLMDPVTRARYDRRGQRRVQPGESFFDAFYRHTGGAKEAEPTGAKPSARKPARGARNPGNDVTLDDLFNDFGFGGPPPPGRPRATRAAAGPEPARAPRPGDDVHVDLEVPQSIAETGGAVTAVYHRLQRSDSWRPGTDDPGLIRVQDIADVRIIPGTRDGTRLRERGAGDAGAYGGPYGDLVARVSVVPGRSAPPPAPPPAEAPDDEVVVDISVVEALLGGRVPVELPGGPVRLAIPPCTSGGTRLRLRGKGPVGPDGRPADLYVRLRIVVPRSLDDESRRLVEEFARLNPDLSR